MPLISAVRVEGAKNTRYSFLESIIQPVISQTSSSDHPSTLDEVLLTAKTIAHSLRQTDIFSSVDVQLEKPRNLLAGPEDVDLVFKTKEGSRFRLSFFTEAGNNEATATASMRIRNAFGGAESVEANMSYGSKTRQAFRGTVAIPLTSNMNTLAEFSAYMADRDLTAFASCHEGLRASKFAWKHGTPAMGMHEIAYEGVIRHITQLLPSASISMREEAGISIKSSISQSFKYDTRDAPIAATRGSYGKFYHELAGLLLGGDAHFYKVEAEGQSSRKIWDGFSISLATRAGILWGLGEKGRSRTLFSDRFQLGGPTSVRGFGMNSLGPRDGSNFIGGQLYYSAGISAISDLPIKRQLPIKLHVWMNAGRLDELDQARSIGSTLLSSLSSPSISVGLGLLWRLDPARIEVNFGVPLVTSKSDGVWRGLQAGFGLEFL